MKNIEKKDKQIYLPTHSHINSEHTHILNVWDTSKNTFTIINTSIFTQTQLYHKSRYQSTHTHKYESDTQKHCHWHMHIKEKHILRNTFGRNLYKHPHTIERQRDNDTHSPGHTPTWWKKRRNPDKRSLNEVVAGGKSRSAFAAAAWKAVTVK